MPYERGRQGLRDRRRASTSCSRRRRSRRPPATRARSIDDRGLRRRGRRSTRSFYDKTYYLGAREDGEDAYRLLHDALERTGRGRRSGASRSTTASTSSPSGRSTTCSACTRCASPTSSSTPRSDLEIAEPRRKAGRARGQDGRRSWSSRCTSEFRPSDYEDSYREAVLELIEAQGARARRSSGPSRRSPSEDVRPDGRAARRASTAAKRLMPRSLWTGSLSFGLVNVPVQLFSAARDLDVHFRQLHEKDGAPIEMRRFCSKEDVRGRLRGGRPRLRARQRQAGRPHRRGARAVAAAQDAHDRDRVVRRPRRRRPHLLRPPVLARAGRRERGHAARLPAAGRGDGRDRPRRARALRHAHQGVPRARARARRAAQR